MTQEIIAYGAVIVIIVGGLGYLIGRNKNRPRGGSGGGGGRGGPNNKINRY